MNVEQIAGRYKLQGRLGFGGMSTVHLALDTRLERQVAVKLLAEHLAEDPTFVSRFQREAQAAARLVHPNIVQVFDSGLDEGSGQHFIVMEYIEGASCAELLREQGWVEVPEALAIVEQACEGLAYAHRHGVVHRDVKPGNLLRSRDRVVKLADFGIAKATEQSSITQIGSVLGTAAYLAPEQARGEEAGPRADLYALGVVTYQLISGRLPYEATSLTELALKQQQQEPTPLDSLVAAVSPELADAVSRSLALDPLERWSDGTQMGKALAAGARGEVTSATRQIARDEATSATRVISSRPVRSEPAARSSGARAPRSGAQGRREVTPRRPRPAPIRARQAQEPPRPAPARRAGRRGLVVLLIMLAFVAGAVAAVAASNSGSSGPQLVNVLQNDLGSQVSALKQLVSQNTR
jgi:serine/threonine-protein kinase